MDNAALQGAGPSFIGDLVRMGGDPTGNMTDAQLAGSGPSMPGDLARMGGTLVSPVISGTPVLTGQDAVAYAGFTVSAVGGTEPYVFSLVGTWPAGLSINSETGAVTGTPTEDGTFSDLSVRVTDDDSETDDLPTFEIVIAAAE